MGQRSGTETLFGIIAAFIEKRTWSQADLARKLETRPETVRKRLVELQASGFKLEREEDPPQVYWSVPKNWFPGAVVFKPEEVGDLLRLMGRAPRGQLRGRLLDLVVTRLANLGPTGTTSTFDPEAVRPIEVGTEEERWLSLIEDAVAKKVTLKMRYFTASRRSESWRHVSVHRVDLGPRPHFIGMCHRTETLRRFRVSGVSDARLDPSQPFQKVSTKDLQAFDRDSLGGFHQPKPAVACSFVVREEDSAWVARNLPDGRITEEAAEAGVRFRIETTAVTLLARFVVGLGASARAETPLLAAEVAEIARGALAQTKNGES